MSNRLTAEDRAILKRWAFNPMYRYADAQCRDRNLLADLRSTQPEGRFNLRAIFSGLDTFR